MSKLQNLTINLEIILKKKRKIIKSSLWSEVIFSVDNEYKQLILDEFTDENSNINPYLQDSNHQLDIENVNDVFDIFQDKE